MVWRDLRLRYKQTLVGAGWAVLQPLALMLVYNFFLGRITSEPVKGVPYPVFLYAGLVIWQFFSKGVSQAATSLWTNQDIITRVYFPRLFLPFSVIVGGLVDLGCAVLPLFGLMAYYRIGLSWLVLLAPLFVALTTLCALAVGLWLAALDARYRDVRQFLPFLLQLWLFMSPVVYPTSIVPPSLQFLYSLNPLVGAVDGFRWVMLPGLAPPNPLSIALSTAVTIVLLWGGLRYFRRTEGTLADVI